MSIRTTEYCDICEFIAQKKGIESAIIKNPQGRPAFAQMMWTYYKKGLQILKKMDGSDEPILEQNWLGAPNRLEFCDDHSKYFNVMLKNFCTRDYDLIKLLDKQVAEDDEEWAEKQTAKEKEFKEIHRAWQKTKKVVDI